MARRGDVDREMGAFTILGFAVAVVLLTVIVYFLWRAYTREQQAATQPATRAATQARAGATQLGVPPATRGGAEVPIEARHVFGGLPRAKSPGEMPIKVLRNRGYISGYSEQRKNPVWVAYRVFDAGWVDIGPRPQRFSIDERTTSRVKHEDYTGSGFDRGHMAPNFIIAKCYGQQAQMETFLMTNISPQRPTLNQKVWESLERLEADAYPKRFGEVWVVCGPVFEEKPRVIGVSRVQVPGAFYKILLEKKSGRPRTMQVIMPQTVVESDREDLRKFAVTVRKVEEETKLEFFAELGAEERERILDAAGAVW